MLVGQKYEKIVEPLFYILHQKSTHNHPSTKGIAGTPIIMDSFRQSLTRYASPASAMLDRLKEYHMEQPAVLR